MTASDPTAQPSATVLTEFPLTTNSGDIVMRHLETGMGERVEFVATADDGHTDRLQADALALESLAWQDDDAFTELFDTEYSPPIVEDSMTAEHTITVTNEYAHAELRCLRKSTTGYLEVKAPKKRERILLDATGLSALARQDHSVFSDFLETPHGPDDHH
jgi:hypothetical protein